MSLSNLMVMSGGGMLHHYSAAVNGGALSRALLANSVRNHQQRLGFATSGHNCVAAVPATGKTPPTLEEFDPLNPGEWQLGVGGKILPRLPEGTRCGKLVMGKYGLYAPHIRRFQENLLKQNQDQPTYMLWKPQRYLYYFLNVSLHLGFLFAIVMAITIVNGKPFWPFIGLFKWSGMKWQGMENES